MERRRAIATAAAASLTLLAGGTGIALSSGIVGGQDDGPVGRLDPVTATAATGDPALRPSPVVLPTDGTPTTVSSASGSGDGHEELEDGDDHEGEDHGDGLDEDRREDDERHYEGGEDDD